MRWATRRHCHVDRAACAWLIRRFIDPEAEFVFVDDPDEVPEDATPFDMRGVELGHHAGRCSFETILHRQGLADPALHEIAAMVHDADLDDEKFGSPEAAGLDTVIRGLGLVISDDHQLLEYTHRLYDGLYAWASQAVQS